MHPNDSGHRAIADRLAPVLTGHLGGTPVPSNTIKLVNRNSGKALDVGGGSTADGGRVIQYRDTGGTNQHWQLVGSAGFTTLVNRNSGKVLEVNAGSTVDGASIVQWTGNDGMNQQWTTSDVAGLQEPLVTHQ